MKKTLSLILLLLFCTTTFAQKGMNRPYADNKVFHWGFSLGLNFMDLATPESRDTINGDVYHVRQSFLMPGFSVGFITDVRLSKHLNLRFTPTLHFGNNTLKYQTESGKKDSTDILRLPISLPLYLKWSAEREANYRPYLIAGGGVSFDIGADESKPLLQKSLDYFIELGAGCDIYFQWFKLCPQLTYSIGFNNILVPVSERPDLPQHDHFYTTAMSKMLSRQITLTFNFE